MDDPRPHVLLIVDQFPKALGGGERVLLRLAALLPKHGYRVSILTFAIHPESSAVASPPCALYLLPLTRTYDLNAFRAAFALKRFLHEQNVRLVQTFFESSDIWAGLVVKKLSKAKLVWSRRDMGILRGRKHDVAYRILAAMPDKVFAVSEEVRRHCIEVDGIAPEKVTVTYNGLDLAGWRDPSSLPEQSVVTTVGNIRRIKGHDLLIRAAALVVQRFPDAQFTIAGEVLEPEYWSELRQLIQDLSLSENFRFVGGLRNLQQHLQSATIFVLPSRSEGFSNAIIEAMAATLPVVATDVGGNAEAVLHNVSGFVVPPENVQALTEAMSQLLENRDLAAEMGRAGRARVEQKFTTEAMMRVITSAYAELLGTR